MSPDEDAGSRNAKSASDEDDFLYLQENFTLTDGIFIDENIVFDDIDA